MEQPRSGGLYFEEMEEGQEMTSPGRTVTEADVVTFAGLSGDYNPLHTDAEYARGSSPSPRAWPTGWALSRARPSPLSGWSGSSKDRFSSATPSP